MNIHNFRMEPSLTTPGDWIIFGEIYDNEGNLLGTYGQDGTSVFTWWSQQDSFFQQDYAQLFSTVMANQIVAGTVN